MPQPSSHRSRGSIRVARSLWYTGPNQVELRSERLPPSPPGLLTIETHYSAISRGTERLIFAGNVPPAEWQRMRAPFQCGDFPFPVKYGYSAAGIVVDGPPEWIGARTFALYPHQDVFTLPIDRVTRLPDTMPLKRATLAANMETALNAIWDGGAGPGDKIVVVGAGIVGLLVTYLSNRLPGTKVHVIDINPARAGIVEALGGQFCQAGAEAEDAIGDTADIVFHTSASGAGLTAAIAHCGFEATLVEMSWYGNREITLSLGGAFHSKRLRLLSSQVGHVSESRRARWSYARRLETAAGLLEDAVLDQLVEECVAFDHLPSEIGSILSGEAGGLSPVIAYPAAN